MSSSQQDDSPGSVCPIPPLPAPHFQTYPSTSEYAILTNRFKLLNLVQCVAHRDVMEMISTIGLEALASRTTMQCWMKAGELGLTESIAGHASSASESKPTLHSPNGGGGAYELSPPALLRADMSQRVRTVGGNDRERSHVSQKQTPSTVIPPPPHHHTTRAAIDHEELSEEAAPRAKFVPRYRTRAQREWFFNQLAQPRHCLRVVNDSDGEYDENRYALYAVKQQQRTQQDVANGRQQQENYFLSHQRIAPMKAVSTSHVRHDAEDTITKDDSLHRNPHGPHRSRQRRHGRAHAHSHRSAHPHRYADNKKRGDSDNYDSRDRHHRGHRSSNNRSRSRSISVEMDEDEDSVSVNRQRRGQQRHYRRHRHRVNVTRDRHLCVPVAKADNSLGESTNDYNMKNMFDSNYGKDSDTQRSTSSNRSSSSTTTGRSEAKHRAKQSSLGEDESHGASAPPLHANEAMGVTEASVSDAVPVLDDDKVSKVSSTAMDTVDDAAQGSRLRGRAATLALSISQVASSGGSAKIAGVVSVPHDSQTPSQLSTMSTSNIGGGGGGSPGNNYENNYNSSKNNAIDGTNPNRSSHHPVINSHHTTSSTVAGTTPAIHGMTSSGSVGGSSVATRATPASRGAFAPKAKPKGAVDSPRVPMQAIQHAAALLSRQREEQQQPQQQRQLPTPTHPPHKQTSSPSLLTRHAHSSNYADAHVVRLRAVLPSSHSLLNNTASSSSVAADTTQSITSLPAPSPKESHPLLATSCLSETDQSALRALSQTIDGLLSSHRRILGNVVRNVCLDGKEDSEDKMRTTNDSNAVRNKNTRDGNREKTLRQRGRSRSARRIAIGSVLVHGKDAQVGDSDPSATVVTVEMNSSSSGAEESDDDDDDDVLAKYDMGDANDDESRHDALLLAQMRRRVTAMYAEVSRMSKHDAKEAADTSGASDACDADKENVHRKRASQQTGGAEERRRLRGALPAAICDRLRAYQLTSFEHMTYQEKQWNSSTTSQFVFAQRLTNSLFEDCFDDVMTEVGSIMDTYVDGLAEHELQ